MNEAVRDVAREHGAVLADAARVVPPGPRYFADFVHFSNAGAERMAALLGWQLRPQNTILRGQIFILQEKLLVHRSRHVR